MAFGGQGSSSQGQASSNSRTTSDEFGHTDTSGPYSARDRPEPEAGASQLFRGTTNEQASFSAGAPPLAQGVGSNEEARRQQHEWMSHGIADSLNSWPVIPTFEGTRRLHERRPDDVSIRRTDFGVDASQNTYSPLLQASGLASSSGSSASNTTQDRLNLPSQLSRPTAATAYQRADSSDTQWSSSNQSEDSPRLPHASTSAVAASSTSTSTGAVDVKVQKRAEEILKRIRTRAPDSKEGVAACDYCRKRKIKCDREKPSCSRCSAAGRVCLTTDTLRKRGPPSKKERELLAAEGIHFVPSRHRSKSDLASRDARCDGGRRTLTTALEPPLRSSSTSLVAKRSATSAASSSIGRGRAYTAGTPFMQPQDMDPLPLLKGRQLSLSWVDPSGARRAGGESSFREERPPQQFRTFDKSPARDPTGSLQTDHSSSGDGQQSWMSGSSLDPTSYTAPTSGSTSSSSPAEQRWATPGSSGQRDDGGGGGGGVQSGFVRPYQPYEEVPSPHSKSTSYYSGSSGMMQPAGGLPGPHGAASGLAQAEQEQQNRWRQAEEVSPRSTGRFGPPHGGQGQYQG
jgi:hypothetical protein